MLVGGHVSSSGGIFTAIDRIEAIGGNAVQLFTQSPRMWRPTSHGPAALARFRERRVEAGVGYVLCHALYLINLATPDADLYEKSVGALVNTIEVAREIEGDVVVHVGSHQGAGFEAGLERIAPALARVLEETADATWLLVENSAGAGGTIGRSIEELIAIVDRLEHHPRLGLCLDSCHLWVSGIDVSDPEVVDRTLGEIDERVGLDRLRALHVNDAATPLGSNRDRHANIGEGLIGEGLGVLVRDASLQETPMILETPGPDGHGPDSLELAKLRNLHAGALGVAR